MKQFNDYKYGFLIEAYKKIIEQSLPTAINKVNMDLAEEQAEQWAEMSIRMLPKEELGNNGEEKIPDGQREDMAELNEEDIKVPF